MDYELKQNRKVLKTNVFDVINLYGVDFNVKADVIFENKKNIEVVKYVINPTEYSNSARKTENKPENSLELVLLLMLGQKLYPNKKVISSIYSLKSKDDKLNKYVDEFEKRKGKNIVYLDNLIEENDYLKELIKTTEIGYHHVANKEKCKDCLYNDICNYQENLPMKQEYEKISNKSKASGSLKLNYEQKYFINFKNGFLRVNAVAGAGKTTMLALRVVNLLNSGVKPEEILLITFTDKGKNEILEKVKYWAEEEGVTEDINKLKIHTFNNLGYEMIKKYYALLGFTEEPKLIDTVEEYDIIKQLISDVYVPGLNYTNLYLNLPYAKGAVVEMANIFDNIKNFKIDNVMDFTYLIEDNQEKAEICLKLYNKYNELLKQKNLIKYQDQVNLLYDLLVNHNIKLDFKHIIVDEFQDSDIIQIEILKVLTESPEFKSLVVIGDDMQAIYGFRNVTSDNILNFHLIFKGTQDISFEKTHRNTQQIISLANKIIDTCEVKLNKKLVSEKIGKNVELIKFENEEKEYEKIAEIVEEKIKEGIKKEEIAIISRQKKELLEIKKYLDAKNIPNVVVASELYLDNVNVRNIINFSKFFINFDDNFALLTYLNMKKIKEENMKKIKEDDLLSKVEELKQDLINQYMNLSDEEDKINLFTSLVSPLVSDDEVALSFIEFVKEKHNKFNGMINYMIKFLEYNCTKTIEKNTEDVSAVILTTAHSSKGREFDVVINTINNYKFEKEDYQNEEEKRLLYVSVTRAKEELYITFNKTTTFTNYVQNLFL